MRTQSQSQIAAQNSGSRAVRVMTFVLGFWFIAGCKLPRVSDPVIGASYTPHNVHRLSDWLDSEIRRVAVLPVTCDATQNQVEAGRDLLEALLPEELGKMKKFELVAVLPEQLRRWTGRTAWTAEERLPADFFKLLGDELGCDAVLFCRVTQFHAYPPLVVGLQFKLVGVQYSQLLWVADDVIDAADPSVVNGARRYQQAQDSLPASLADSRSILNSPRRFGRYAASTLFATLPER